MTKTRALAAALVLVWALAPATAAANPLAGGTAEIRLSDALMRWLQAQETKVAPRGAASMPSRRVIDLPVAGGAIDPVGGTGNLDLRGGFAFGHGGASAVVASISVNTSAGVIRAKVAGKAMKLAHFSGLAASRDGFDSLLSLQRVQLTAKAARRLQRTLFPSSDSRPAQIVFGSLRASVEPSTVEIAPGGLAYLVSRTASSVAVAKLFARGAIFQPIPPASLHYSFFPPGALPTVVSTWLPTSGGSISPDGTVGSLRLQGGVSIEATTGDPRASIRATSVVLDLSGGTVRADLAGTGLDRPNQSTPVAGLDVSRETIKVDPESRTIQLYFPSVILAQPFATLANRTFSPVAPPPGSDLVAGDHIGELSISVTAR